MRDVVMVVTTVVTTKSDSEGILCLQLLTKQLMCIIHLIKCESIDSESRKRFIQTILKVFFQIFYLSSNILFKLNAG